MHASIWITCHPACSLQGHPFASESEGRPPEPPGESGDVGAELPGTVCIFR